MTNDKMTNNYEITVNENVFNEVFYDDFNEHGYQNCGLCIHEFTDVYNHNDYVEHIEIFKKLPNEIKSNAMNFLIKSDNLKSFIKNHILTISETDENDFYKMIEIIKQNEPNKIDDDENEIKYEYINEFADFIYDEMLNNTKLTINGQKIYVLNYNEFDKIQINIIEQYYKNK